MSEEDSDFEGIQAFENGALGSFRGDDRACGELPAAFSTFSPPHAADPAAEHVDREVKEPRRSNGEAILNAKTLLNAQQESWSSARRGSTSGRGSGSGSASGSGSVVGGSQRGDAEAAAWCCEACTFLNGPGSLACEVCCTGRPRKRLKPAVLDVSAAQTERQTGGRRRGCADLNSGTGVDAGLNNGGDTTCGHGRVMRKACRRAGAGAGDEGRARLWCQQHSQHPQRVLTVAAVSMAVRRADARSAAAAGSASTTDGRAGARSAAAVRYVSTAEASTCARRVAAARSASTAAPSTCASSVAGVGSVHMAHGRNKSLCKQCGGGAICEHGRERRMCKDCGGNGICKHGLRKDGCRECGGRTCEHGRRKDRCTAYRAAAGGVAVPAPAAQPAPTGACRTGSGAVHADEEDGAPPKRRWLVQGKRPQAGRREAASAGGSAAGGSKRGEVGAGAGAGAGPGAAWCCEACTFLNGPGALACEVCRTGRPRKRLQPAVLDVSAAQTERQTGGARLEPTGGCGVEV